MKKTRSIQLRHFIPWNGCRGKAILLVCFLLFSRTMMASYAQSVLNLKLENVTVTEALKKIGAATGFEFFYNSSQLEKCGKQITADFRDLAIQDAMTKVLSGTDFTFRIEDNTIVVISAPAKVRQEQAVRAVEIKGRVTGKTDDEPLVGVTVRIEGTSFGTTTNLEGEYVLKVPEGEYSIVFSFVGLQTQAVKFSGNNFSDFRKIVMLPEAVEMEDVVVTGIYQRKKESFTGSAATFNAEELKSVGTQNVLQSLRTLDPSFRIMENNQFGSDPNRLPDIEIRGKSSVMGLKEEYGTDPNQPLFILDGFETTLSTVMDLNMNRVASVTLLKDAASTAIYGSKASNGVVVIETKKPERGRLQLSYKADFSATMADLSDYNLMDAREKMQFEGLAGIYNDLTNDPMNQLRLDNLRNERMKEIERGVDTYWLSEPLQTGFTHKHNLYVEGGEEKVRYGLGLTYGNVQGVMKGSNRRTIGGNLDLIYRTGDFQFSNKLTLDNVSTNDPAVPFSEYAKANPYYRKYNAAGGVDKYLYNPDPETSESPLPNPLWNAHLNNYDKGEQFGFTNNFIIEWFATTDFRLRGKFGITKYNKTQDTRLSPQHSDFDELSETERGLYTHSLDKAVNYEGDVAATYGRLFAEKHMINAVAGFNFGSNRGITNGYKANGFTEDQFDAPSFANGYPEGGKSIYRENEKHAASFYLNGGYAYDNRYLLDFNYRSDGASMFGTNNRFRNTWSVGIGWNIHHEHFMENIELFQLLKLRGSVGNPGNQNFSAYQAFSTYAFNGWMTNVFGNGVVLNQLGNSDLAWQETMNYNVGADIALFQNRLNVTVDLYSKVTDPLLAIITTPGSLGVKSVAVNAGQQKTKGLEATVKFSPVYRPKERINWNISVNMRHSKAEYAKIGNSFSALNDAGKAEMAGTTRYYDGGSPTAIWAVRSAGIDPATGQELFIKKDGSSSFTYDINDEVEIGNTEPKLEGVIGTSFYFKGLSVGFYFRYRLGGQVFNAALFDKVENITWAGVGNNQDKRALYDRWSPDNREAQFKSISVTRATDKSSRFVMDENTISGESFNIGYEFTQSFVKRMGLAALNMQANMNDIFRYSTVKSERGIDYPFARTLSFSLSATF